MPFHKLENFGANLKHEANIIFSQISGMIWHHRTVRIKHINIWYALKSLGIWSHCGVE
jgi:hypothetical protein